MVLQIKDAGKKHCYRMWTRTLTEYLRQSSQMDSWRTLFVFRDRCVERVDTPEHERKERDRAAIEQERKERKRAYAKAWRASKSDDVKYQEYFKAYRKNYNKAYAAANKDYRKARQKEYCAAKRDEIKVKKKEYRAKHRDELKARRKEYYAAKRDDVLAKQKKYYAAKRDDVLAQQQEYRRTKLGCVECKSWPDWREGLPHYDGMCYRCFCEKFPTHEKVRTKVRVELQVRGFIDTHFEDFVHDKPMHTAHCDCNHRRRVDHRRLVGNTLLCVEVDEHHHRGYDKDSEQARYHDVLCAFGGRLCFVRFNPDGKGPPLEERLERLHSEITRHIGRLERGENTAYLEVWHLYYPKGTPDSYKEQCNPAEYLESKTENEEKQI